MFHNKHSYHINKDFSANHKLWGINTTFEIQVILYDFWSIKSLATSSDFIIIFIMYIHSEAWVASKTLSTDICLMMLLSHTMQHQTIKIMNDEFEKTSIEITMDYMHVQAQY